jgi:hypothetical protein
MESKTKFEKHKLNLIIPLTAPIKTLQNGQKRRKMGEERGAER